MNVFIKAVTFWWCSWKWSFRSMHSFHDAKWNKRLWRECCKSAGLLWCLHICGTVCILCAHFVKLFYVLMYCAAQRMYFRALFRAGWTGAHKASCCEWLPASQYTCLPFLMANAVSKCLVLGGSPGRHAFELGNGGWISMEARTLRPWYCAILVLRWSKLFRAFHWGTCPCHSSCRFGMLSPSGWPINQRFLIFCFCVKCWFHSTFGIKTDSFDAHAHVPFITVCTSYICTRGLCVGTGVHEMEGAAFDNEALWFYLCKTLISLYAHRYRMKFFLMWTSMFIYFFMTRKRLQRALHCFCFADWMLQYVLAFLKISTASLYYRAKGVHVTTFCKTTFHQSIS